MSLYVSPPLRETSLWQTICETHGVIIQAHPQVVSLLAGRLHDFNEKGRCRVYTGIMRCVFCFDPVEAQRWPPNASVTCGDCFDHVRDRLEPEQHSTLGLDLFFAVATPSG